MQMSNEEERYDDEYPDDSMAVTSLRFCISHPTCHTVIPGAKTSNQVTENCIAGEKGEIPAELLKRFA